MRCKQASKSADKAKLLLYQAGLHLKVLSTQNGHDMPILPRKSNQNLVCSNHTGRTCASLQMVHNPEPAELERAYLRLLVLWPGTPIHNITQAVHQPPYIPLVGKDPADVHTIAQQHVLTGNATCKHVSKLDTLLHPVATSRACSGAK